MIRHVRCWHLADIRQRNNSIKPFNWARNGCSGVGGTAEGLRSEPPGRSRRLRMRHVFKAIHDLPMPFRAALINAAVKCGFCQSKPPFVGGSASGRRATPNNATSCVDD